MGRITEALKATLAASLLLLVFAGAQPASANVGVDGSVTYVTRYIWRGQDLLPNNDGAIQPSLTLGLPGSLSLNMWGSYGIGGPNEKDELDELDFTLSYSGSITKYIEYTFGHTYYTFHTAGPDESQETFAGVSFKTFLNPAFTLYGDWGSDVSRGYYLLASASHDFSLGWGIKNVAPALTLSVSAGYSDGQWSMEPDLSDLNIGLALPIKAGVFTIKPLVTYTYVPDKASVYSGESSPPKPNVSDEIWGGVAFEFGF